MDLIARHHGLPATTEQVKRAWAEEKAARAQQDDEDQQEREEDQQAEDGQDDGLDNAEADIDEAERVFQANIARNVRTALDAEPISIPTHLGQRTHACRGYNDDDTNAGVAELFGNLLLHDRRRQQNIPAFDSRLAEWDQMKERQMAKRCEVAERTGCEMATLTEPPEPELERKNVFTTAPAALVAVWPPEPGSGAVGLPAGGFVGSSNASLQLLNAYKTDELFRSGLLSAIDRHPHAGHSGRLADPTYPRRSGGFAYDWCCDEDPNVSQIVGQTFERECLERVGARLVQTRGVTIVAGARNRDWFYNCLEDGTWLALEQQTGEVSITVTQRRIDMPAGGGDPIDIPVWIVRSRTAHARETAVEEEDADAPITHIVEFTCHPSYGYFAHGLSARRALYALDVVLYEVVTHLGVAPDQIKFGTFLSFARAPLTGQAKRHRLSQWALLERTEYKRCGVDFVGFSIPYLESAEEGDLADLVVALQAEYEEDARISGAYPPALETPLQRALSAARFRQSEQIRAARVGPLRLSRVLRNSGDSAEADKSVMMLSDGTPVSMTAPRKPVSQRDDLPVFGPGGGVALLSDGSLPSSIGFDAELRRCSICGSTGHRRNRCPKNASPTIRRCSICQSTGHTSETCPKNPSPTVRRCSTCQSTGHRSDSCPMNASPTVRRCSTCQSTGHKSDHCPKNPSPGKGKCSICRSTGHRRNRCPKNMSPTKAACSICRSTGHRSDTCPKNASPTVRQCSFCQSTGHRSDRCPKNPSASKGKCSICGSTGHDKRACPKNASPTVRRCTVCQSTGHRRNHCPQNASPSVRRCSTCGSTGHTKRACPGA